jgi:hypothetical protein
MIRELTKNQKKKALKMLKMLNGLPPYDDGGNICRGDGYFANSIPHYGMTTEELSKACGFDKVYEEWKTIKKAFAERGE